MHHNDKRRSTYDGDYGWKKNKMSWVGILDIINMINKIYERDIMSATMYQLFKNFSLADDDDLTYNLFCPTCQRYLGNRKKMKPDGKSICRSCEGEFDESTLSSFFVSLSFTS